MQGQRAKNLAVTFAVMVFIISVLISCGGEDGDTTPPINIVEPQVDTIPPATVDDLHVLSPSIQSLAIVWQSPGDDGDEGAAAAYDIRYSLATITDGNWTQAASIDPRIISSPKPSGQIETIVVLGLDPGTEYFFALKTTDESDNWSGLSNCASGVTDGELNPPGEVTDLEARAVDDYSFELTWTAPGDDGYLGRAAKYDVRYSTEITTGEDWESMTPVAVTPVPVDAGETQSFIIHGLAYQSPHSFALKTADEMDNWSGVSNVSLALGFGQDHWVFPRTLKRGDILTIVFQSVSDQSMELTTNHMYYPRVCGQGVIEELVSGVFSDGIHVHTFDFTYQDTGEDYDAGFYWIALCHAGVPVWAESVELRN